MSTGLKGTLQLLAMLAVLLLAALALGFALKLATGEQLLELAGQGLATLFIVALAALALGVLLRSRE